MDDDWGHIIFRQPPYTKNAEWWLEFVSIFGRLWMLLHMRFGFEFPRGVCVCVCANMSLDWRHLGTRLVRVISRLTVGIWMWFQYEQIGCPAKPTFHFVVTFRRRQLKEQGVKMPECTRKIGFGIWRQYSQLIRKKLGVDCSRGKSYVRNRVQKKWLMKPGRKLRGQSRGRQQRIQGKLTATCERWRPRSRSQCNGQATAMRTWGTTGTTLSVVLFNGSWMLVCDINILLRCTLLNLPFSQILRLRLHQIFKKHVQMIWWKNQIRK